VPAGPLLDSRWTSLAAALGFDVVTYKTVRTVAHSGHALPNILLLDCPSQLFPGGNEVVHVSEVNGDAESPSSCPPAITNAFGMPSMAPDYLSADIPVAQAALAPGQVRIGGRHTSAARACHSGAPSACSCMTSHGRAGLRWSTWCVVGKDLLLDLAVTRHACDLYPSFVPGPGCICDRDPQSR